MGRSNSTSAIGRSGIYFPIALDVRYPAAETVVLVMDQLNIHSPASLCVAFPAAGAMRFADRLELRHTPKHGSRLNIAELELAIPERR